MRLLIIVMFLCVSNISNADCLKIIPIRIDNSYSECEQEVIRTALHNWKVASNNRICFIITTDNIHIKEMFTHRNDGISTIYNNNLWVYVLSMWKRRCYGNCVGFTINDILHEAPDIFILIKYHFPHLITHEIGHLLGLDHSKDRRDIMFEYVRKDTTISAEDKKVLDCLIKNNEVLSWKSKCQYKGNGNVVPPKRQDKVGYIKDKNW